MTSPEQLPPTYELGADARWQMRERLLAEITGAEATGRSRRRVWAAPAAVAASVLLAAGGVAAVQSLTGSRTTTPSGSITPAGSVGPTGSGPVHGQDCGSFVLKQGERLPESAVRCLTGAAAAGEPARLRQTRPSVEGDPIVTTYLVEGRERIRVVIDSRADPSGTGDVHRQSCTRLTQVDSRLVTDGCTESTSGG